MISTLKPTRRHTSCKPDGREHGHAHHPHPRRAQPACAIGPYEPCKQAKKQQPYGPAGMLGQNSEPSLTPACATPSLGEGYGQACSVLGPEQGTEQGMLPRYASQGLQQKPVPNQQKRNARQHSGYSNCSIHTLHTAEILQLANSGGQEEEARVTALCMAWHAQQETSSCDTIPTDTGRRGHSASTTSFTTGGVAMRVQYKQGQTAKER